MIKKITILLLVLISIKDLQSQNFWDKLNSPPGGVVVSFAIDNNNIIYAGTNVGGMYKTSNEGNNWTQINNGLQHFRIASVAVRDNFVFAGTGSAGVYRSSDRGDSWTQINNGMPNIRVSAFVHDPNFIFAATDSGVYRSANNGDLWSPVNDGLTNRRVNALAMNGSNLFAGTDAGVFYSNDNGLNWIIVNSNFPSSVVNALVIHGNNLFAGTGGFGVFRSINNGVDWSQVNSGLANFTILSFASAAGIIYTGTEGGIFRSNNDGNNWVQINNGLTNLFANTLLIAPSFIVAGTNSGVFRSSDGGDSWTKANTGIASVNPLSLVIVGNRIYAGSSGGVYHSANDGNTWSELNNGLTSLLVYSLTNNGTYIFAGTNGGVYRLSIGGSTWTQVNNGLSNLFGNALAVSGEFIFVGTNAGVFRSSNNGNSWSPMDIGLSSSVIELAVNENYVFAGTNGSGVYRSPLDGNNWEEVNTGIVNRRVRALTTKGDNVLGGTNTGIYSSANNGDSWIDANEGLTSPLVTALESGINFFFAATDGGGVHVSSNNGSTWQPVNGGLLTQRITTISMGENGYLYTVTYDPSVPDGNGIYKSVDPYNKQIRVQTPAASAVWEAGTRETVTWTSTNVNENVNIKLSTDGGSTFPITLSTNTENDGTQSVNVPDNPSATCRIIVESAIDDKVFGRSGTFTIMAAPEITVTSPDQSSVWTVAEQQTITWTSVNVTGNVNLWLSTDGGTTFPVALKLNSPNDGTELITVPDNPSNTCVIKVESADNNEVFGLSQGNFVINAQPSITVTEPAASAEWVVGTQQSVQWTSVNVTGNFNIKLSTDGGTTYPVTLKENTANDGNEVVDVPDSPSDNCMIKVESQSDNNIFGISPGSFTIVLPVITVTAPDEGDEWKVGSQQTITWASENVTGNVNITLSTDGGTTFPVTLKSNVTNDGNENITVPNNPSLTSVVKVESRNDNDIFGLSGSFSITLAPVIVVTSPSAAANWTIGSDQTITWTSVNVTGNVNIKLSTDGGSTFPVTLVSATPNDSSETITVPNNSSSNCVIKVESTDDNNIFGVSSGTFTITSAPTITVTKPEAGANWIVGTVQEISWSSVNVTGGVNIKMSIDGGSTYPVVLRTNVSNDGTDTITVPDNTSNVCRIRVESSADNGIFGLNPGDFSISDEPSITVTSPAASVNWTIGTQATVTWSSVNISGNVNIKLSTDGGVSFPLTLKTNTIDDGSEVIDVPDNTSASCVVKVESVDDINVFGLSGTFTITSEPTITVTQPAASVKWTIGSQQTVVWTSVNITGNVNIKLSIDGGTTYPVTLAADIPNDGTEQVDVPDNPSTLCRVKVESVTDNATFGVNPGNFIISTEPSIVVTEPAASANWSAGSSQNVIWNSVNVTGNINIKLSTDGGTTYTIDLKSDIPNDGSESVDVPSNASNTCRIKVESVDDNNIFGLNPGNFAITTTAAASVSVTDPAALTVWLVGSQKTITWASENLTSNVNIKLSTDGGTTFPVTLKSDTPNDNSEIITVPDNPSTTCRILIESVTDSNIKDMNDANFTVAAYPQQITLNTTKSFNDVNDIRSYRIVGIPGSGSIAASMSGQYEFDWQVFWDNGNAEDYLVSASNYTFSPGKAYWILSKNAFVINQQVNTVQLSNDDTYSIPLHAGWNLISNPFDKNVSWASVRALNGLGENQKLYAWNGNWDSLRTQMAPYEGYYFNNTTNKQSIKIPYQMSSPNAVNKNEYPHNIDEFLKVSVKLNNRKETSIIYIGTNPSAKNEYDDKDYFMPPGDFIYSSVSLIRKELPERSRRFFIEQRPAIEEGQTYDVEIKTIPNELTEVEVSGIEYFNDYEIYLLDERLNNLYNLKENKKLKLRLAHKYNNFKIIVGTNAFVTNLTKNTLPQSYALFQNYPNPFNPSTAIRFSLPFEDNIRLTVYTITGEVVETLINDELYQPGNYEIQFSGINLSSGIYIVEMHSSKFTAHRKMLLLK